MEARLDSSSNISDDHTLPSIVGGIDALRAEVENPSAGINRGELRTVELRFIIESNGTLTAPEVISSSSVPSVDRAVLAGLRSVGWNPGTVDGTPVRMQITMPVEVQRAEWDW